MLDSEIFHFSYWSKWFAFINFKLITKIVVKYYNERFLLTCVTSINLTVTISGHKK